MQTIRTQWLTRKHKVWLTRSSNSQWNVYKEDQTNKQTLKRKKDKQTLAQKFQCSGLYATMYKSNLRIVRDYAIEKPAYADLYTWLCARATCVQELNFSKRRKNIKEFKAPLQFWTKTKHHTLNQGKDWARINRINPQQFGFPSRVTSSVV